MLVTLTSKGFSRDGKIFLLRKATSSGIWSNNLWFVSPLNSVPHNYSDSACASAAFKTLTYNSNISNFVLFVKKLVCSE